MHFNVTARPVIKALYGVPTEVKNAQVPCTECFCTKKLPRLWDDVYSSFYLFVFPLPIFVCHILCSFVCCNHGTEQTSMWEWIKSLRMKCFDEQHKHTNSNCAPPLYTTTPQVMRAVTGLSTPEAVMAEVIIPPPDGMDWSQMTSRLLVLDRIQDPGNLGNLLRTAMALGWDGAVLLDTCCDPFHEKSISASRGACFTLPLSFLSINELFDLLRRHEFMTFLAHTDHSAADRTIKGEKGTSSPSTPLNNLDRKALVLGNEHHGLHPCWNNPEIKSDLNILQMHIEMSTRRASGFQTEEDAMARSTLSSLNVAAAGAILMQSLRVAGRRSDHNF